MLAGTELLPAPGPCLHPWVSATPGRISCRSRAISASTRACSSTSSAAEDGVEGLVHGTCGIRPFVRQRSAAGVRSVSRVTSDGQRTGCANRIFSVQLPFPVCESIPRTTWVQGFPHAATKTKVDAEHPARKPDLLPRDVVVILEKCPAKSRSNAPFPTATAGSR